jgi:hypothetical protein
MLIAGSVSAQTIKIVEQKEKKQLDVYVGQQLFTSYCYWDSQKKPILYPLQTAKGTVVTRSYPVAKVAGERTGSSASRLGLVQLWQHQRGRFLE